MASDEPLEKENRTLNGEPMETPGEVIVNIGLVVEHLDRELR